MSLLDHLPKSEDDALDAFMAWVASTGLQPYPAQEEAILELFSDNHVFLTTPTGSGKSLVALAVHFRSLVRKERSIYTAPIKALVAEKHRALVALFGDHNVGIMTGDGSRNRDAPILCATAEILARIALREGASTPFQAAILDEFHFYGERDRGMAWQLPLLTLPHTQFLMMSATLGPTKVLQDDLLERTGRTAIEISSQERPVPLTYRYMEEKLDQAISNLVGRFAPIYAVHFTQRNAAEHAQALLSTNLCTDAEKEALKTAIKGFRFDSPYGKNLRRIVLHGVGLHHAGLLPKYRALMEQLAQRGLFKVICGTDTLGVGINVPIRSVLFTQLCKFDGTDVDLLTARHFHQIAGRAGRKGFDDQGLVAALAPEWVVENAKLEELITTGTKKRSKVKKKSPPTRGYKHWDEATFELLQHKRPEALTPIFEVDHGVVLEVLQRATETLEDGMGSLHALIETSHASARAKERLHADADARLAQLLEAGVAIDGGEDALPRYTLHTDLQDDFSLHHALSLYLLHALEQLDPEHPEYPWQVLTQVESILEHPGPVLAAQTQKAKGERIAELKAEGVPYEDRLDALEDIAYPKPMDLWIYALFNDYKATRPWLERAPIRPKSVARQMAETQSAFSMYVKDLGLERSEGVLLRYLSQVYRTLVQNVPERFHTPEIDDIVGYLRAMLARVDDSLVTPFEVGAEDPEGAEKPFWADPKPLRARIRNEMMGLIRALAAGDWEEAAATVRDGFDADDFQRALAPYLEERGPVRFDARVRQGWTTVFHVDSPQHWRVTQVLVDDDEDSAWSIEATVDLTEDPSGPLLSIVQIGE